MSKLTISYNHYKQADKWHYEIREGNNPFTGRIISEGHNYSSKIDARKAMNKQIKRIIRSTK